VTSRPYWHDAQVTRKHDITRLLAPLKPKGRRFETEADAADSGKRIQAGLATGPRNLKELATRLSECQIGHYVCRSPLCLLCARQYRRWLTSQLLRIAESGVTNRRILTLYLGAYQVGCLADINIAKSHDSLRKRLQRAGLADAVVIGGTELSFQARRSRWILHVHLLVIGASEDAVQQLRQAWRRDIAHPVKCQPLQDPPRQLSYLQKFCTFHRPGKQRSNRRSPAFPLPNARLREYALWIADHNFEDFLFLFGARRLGASIRVKGRRH
jgi:hypothetical protein